MSNLLPSTAATDIITYVRGRCRLGTAPPNAVFQTTQMLVALNDINEWFMYWPLDHGGMAPWKFSRKSKLYEPVDHTTLAVAAAAGATSLTLTSGSDFDSPSSDAAGFFLKNSDGAFAFGTYESRASAVLSSVNGIDIGFDTSTEVHKIYTLPSDYGRSYSLRINRNPPSKFVDDGDDEPPPPGCYATQYLTSSSLYDNFYLVLPLLIGSGVTAKLRYVKRPTIITTGTDKVDARDGTARWALIKKFEEFCWFHRGEMDLSLKAGQDADALMRTYASAQSSEDASPDQGPTFDLD